ncbi:MAG: ShlB/FhaC/HecB family hemolysin secretion/activation protein [Rhizobiaceae bacterium]|nr:ShlB/FhaC/HecB family hemolysin secretion/activation protein [Rhizobiaceae bacterium]
MTKTVEGRAAKRAFAMIRPDASRLFARARQFVPIAGLMAGAGLISVSLCSPAFAQQAAPSASQIVAPSFRPQTQSPGAALVIPEGTGLTAPAGAEKLKVRLSGLDVEGRLPALQAETAATEQKLSGRTVTAAEVFAAARQLEEAYVKAGYPLVRVVLPAQKLNDGARLKLVVIDGVIETVDVGGLPKQIRDHIAAVLAPLVGRHGVTQAEIERLLLLAGDTPGTALRSTLKRGNSQGGTVLMIDAGYHPVTGSLGFDNSLPSSIGRWTATTGLEFNSLLGFGEQFYLHASGYPSGGDNGFFSDDPRNRVLVGGVVVPLGSDGLTVNLEGTTSKSTPETDPGFVPTQSRFNRFSARLAYPVIRSRELTVNLNGVFDAEDEKVSALDPDVALSLDRLRVFRAGADANWLSPWDATVTGRLTASFGIDGLGARSAADASAALPLSRQGADANFQKLEVALGYSQSLAEHLAVDLKANAQTSFGQPLASAEQIGIDGPSALSAFGSGALEGDSGVVIRGEVQAPFQWSFSGGAALASPYLFGAAGLVRIEEPTAVESSVTRAAAYGLGVRLGAAPTASFTNASLTLEYSRGNTSDTDDATNRFLVIGGLKF